MRPFAAIAQVVQVVAIVISLAIGVGCLDWHITGSCTTSTPPGLLTCSYTPPGGGLAVLCDPQPPRYRVVAASIYSCSEADPGVQGWTECFNSTVYLLIYRYKCSGVDCIPVQDGNPIQDLNVPCTSKTIGLFHCP